MTTPWPADARYLELVDVTVDLRLRRLLLADRSMELPQRVFDLLVLFLSEPHKLHTRATLFDRLWARTVVEDTNLSHNVWLLRKALGEERKSWIRTVAKSGYVFEPPAPLRWLGQLPDAPSALSPGPVAAPISALVDGPDRLDAGVAARDSLPAAGTNAVQREPALQPAADTTLGTATFRPRRRIRFARSIAALALIALVVATLLWRHAQPRPVTSVALVLIEDGSGSSSWPARLLQQWLGWKLDSLPEANLLREGDVAGGAGLAPIDVVFLSSVRVAGDAKKLELHARVIRDGKEERLSATGSPAQMPALADALSRQILIRLLPKRTGPWPKLEVTRETAQRYEGLARAVDRRDWIAATRLGNEIVRAAPRFALARLQLAEAQIQLRQAGAAREQQRVATQLLADAPGDAVATLEARQQAMEIGGTGKALALYEALLARYPDKTSYRLALAELSLLAGQYQRALTLLADAPGQSQPLGMRIAKRMLLAQVYGGVGDPVRMRAAAIEAQRLAQDGGDSWASEQATAWIWRGRAEAYQHPERTSAAPFEEAAKLYRRAGNSTGELWASYLARTAGPPGPDADDELDELLARANAGGYRRLEVTILLANAEHYETAGDVGAYHARLRQASAVANASGDPVLMGEVNMRLLNIELLTAQFDSVEAMAHRQRRLNLSGTARLYSDQFTAALALFRGDARQALATIEATERLLPPTPPGQRESEAFIHLACVRTELQLRLGRLAEARKTWERCRQGERWSTQFYAPSVGSDMELLAGDRPQATVLLDQAQASISKAPPDSWVDAIEVARLATRLGQIERSERIYAETLPSVRSVGYMLLTASILTGMAENAAARGDWKRSRSFAAEASQAVPPDTWRITSRLGLLAAFDARRRGDIAAASTLGAHLHRQARELGDVVVELELHQLFGPDALAGECSQAERDALVARTGMRGVRLDWLDHRALAQAKPAGEAVASELHR
jgi:DNA-binding winged helix-turn-helix (wHTH) protein/tetratricopeptide (TPR) repeat protein